MKYTAEQLPAYFDKWGVSYRLVDGWLSRGRASGGFDAVFGVQIHHGADSPRTSLDTAIQYNSVSGKDAPIGNATVSRDKDGPTIALYAGLAANTAGVGGPRMSSRGVIPQDSANHISFAFEAENNGVDETWSEAMCDLYVLATVAVLDWANNCTPGAPLGAGDVFAHFEWSPGRKHDPAGPSRFNGYTSGALWDMDAFRGEVFTVMVAGPGGNPTPPPEPPPPSSASYTVQPGDGWWKISKALGYPISVLQAFNNWPATKTLHPGDVIMSPGNEPAPPPPPPAPTACTQPAEAAVGETSPVVADLQSLLSSNGWYPYALDSQYGPRTQQGVQKLQRFLRTQGQDPGPLDGVYGTQTRQALCAFMGTPA